MRGAQSMVINDSLYTYGITDKKRDRIIRKIVHGTKVRNLYVVVLPLMNDGILEIYEYNPLLSPFYMSISDEISVVGMADSKDGALCLVTDMVQEMYDSKCDFNVREFFGM